MEDDKFFSSDLDEIFNGTKKMSQGIDVCPKTGELQRKGSKGPDSFIGTVIDSKYKILETLGLGAMGAVYKAEHTMMGRTVALKMLHRHLTADVNDDEFLKRFQREARTASKIDHPNAITLYDFGIHEEQAYLVMQYNTGKTLKAIIEKEGPLDLPRILSIMEQVCLAVEAAHKLGIIHRDLKPENIMCSLDEEGSEKVQVLDFGLAKVVGDSDSPLSTMTQTGIVMGTPHYMAPEQAAGKTLDARTDIYSMGVVLYEMLSGTQPFSAESAMQLMLSHISEKPTPLSEVTSRDDISAALQRVVDRTLKKEGKNRPQSATELLRELKVAIEPGASDSKKTESRKSRPEKILPNTKKRRWSRWAQLSMLLIGISCGIIADPAISYFSPEAIAKRAETEARRKKAKVHLDLARKFNKSRKYRSEAYELIKALKIDPENPKIYYKLGSNYTKQLRLDQAIVVLENAIKLEPEYANAHLLLGNIYYKQRRLQEALSAYQRTLKIEPRNKQAKKNLAACRKAFRTY